MISLRMCMCLHVRAHSSPRACTRYSLASSHDETLRQECNWPIAASPTHSRIRHARAMLAVASYALGFTVGTAAPSTAVRAPTVSMKMVPIEKKLVYDKPKGPLGTQVHTPPCCPPPPP